MSKFSYNLTTTIGAAKGVIEANTEDDAREILEERYTGTHTTVTSETDNTPKEIPVEITDITITELEE